LSTWGGAGNQCTIARCDWQEYDNLKPMETLILHNVNEQAYSVLNDVLQLDEQKLQLNEQTPLIGNLPELDSMAVVTVITALELHFDFIVNDDDDLAAAFETFGSLVSYIEEKQSL
jgi:acyl carrier protein